MPIKLQFSESGKQEKQRAALLTSLTNTQFVHSVCVNVTGTESDVSDTDWPVAGRGQSC